jgi:hypothetical protein
MVATQIVGYGKSHHTKSSIQNSARAALPRTKGADRGTGQGVMELRRLATARQGRIG